MAIYRVVDTETCDLDSGIVEIASIDIIDMQVNYSTQQSHLINPQKSISVSAMATHHITDEMVINSPLIDQVIEVVNGNSNINLG
ncbi:exonuclease domain-containing protein [Photorhabdus kayaii]|uniref:exonuclease domain-containing protein n=1 Tax=Photorhabdus kayaii TaxID=230088 RepID=UPI0021D4F886|nr:exonuclease domain-containing protein [Photorhabdus kayaii]MCT8353871.1 hypothetical protein [Photorhabdus kayaii]